MAEESASTSNAEPSSSGNSLNRDRLFNFLQSAIEPGPSTSRNNENRRNESSRNEESRDFLFGRRHDRMNRNRYDEEEDFYRNARRGPRGYRRGFDDSPERKFSSQSTKPQFRIRENRDYLDIMILFEHSAFYLRRRG
jgi:hypothetical protein